MRKPRVLALYLVETAIRKKTCLPCSTSMLVFYQCIGVVSEGRCLLCKKGQSVGGERCLKVPWYTLTTVRVGSQEKRNAVHPNQGKAIRGSFSPHMYSS